MTVRVVWSPALLEYDFGPQHPMNPLRLDLTMRLAQSMGVLDATGVQVVGAEPAADDVLSLAHTPAYVAAVRRASAEGAPDLEHGLGTEDDPVFAGMHEAAARIVAGTVEGADAVWDGHVEHAVNIAGGMHHAMADHAAGFCLYNDAVAAIRRLLDRGAQRVAYVDLDAHHGDGVEAAFWDDPRVLTVSIHESGATLFPGTGHTTDIGGPHARGHVVNDALPARTGDTAWLRALGSVVLPLARAFAPDVVVSQHGCDAHAQDPLTNLAVSVDAQREAMVLVHELAHEVCDGRWVALGGGGYAVAQVVPRVWTHLLAVAAHRPIDVTAPIPQEWREHTERVFGFPAPAVMGDGGDDRPPRPWSAGFDPADDIDRILLATRRALFEHHDLDPLYD